MLKKEDNRLLVCVSYLYTVMITFIFITVLFFGNTVNYENRRSFLTSNIILFFLGELFIGFLYSLTKNRNSGKMKFIFWLLFFAYQCTVSYFGYFLTGWDAGRVLDNAYLIGRHGSTYPADNIYFSFYHNNVLTALIESWIIRLFVLIGGGEPGIERCALILIFVQSAVCTLSGYLTCAVTERHLPGKYGFCAVAFFLFIGLNPWVMIPYSDGLSVIFPILILFLYDNILNTEKVPGALYWGVLGIISAIAYLIKPQAFIMSIAVCIIHLIAKGNLFKKLRDVALFLFIFFLGTGPVFQTIVDHSPIQLNENLKLNYTQFIMTGLTPETNGAYDVVNAAIAASTDDPVERHERQMKTIHERLQRLGFTGLLKHLFKKNLTNYGDGTFAWAIEGQFFEKPIPDKDSVLSPFIKGVLNPEEDKGYIFFSSFLQCMWLGILFLDCWVFLSFFRRKQHFSNKTAILFVAALSIIGLTAFELIFEARARYLYSQAPIYVLLACFGLNEIDNLCRLKQ